MKKSIIIVGSLALIILLAGPVIAAMVLYPDMMALLGLGLMALALTLATGTTILLATITYIEKREAILLVRTQRVNASHQVIKGSSGQTWIQYITSQGEVHHKALHLIQSTHSNGHRETPTESEAQTWQEFLYSGRPVHSVRSVQRSQPPELHATHTAHTAQIDLIAAITEAQTVLIVGPMGAGKSNLLHWSGQ